MCNLQTTQSKDQRLHQSLKRRLSFYCMGRNSPINSPKVIQSLKL